MCKFVLSQGAPERVIKYCTKMIVDDREVELTDELRDKFVSVYEQLGSLGERVIGKEEIYRYSISGFMVS